MLPTRTRPGDVVILLIAAVALVAAVACGSDDNGSDDAQQTTSSSAQPADPTTTEAADAAAPPAPPIEADGCNTDAEVLEAGDTVCVDGRTVIGPENMTDNGNPRDDVVLSPEPHQCSAEAGCEPRATGLFTGDKVILDCEAPPSTQPPPEELHNHNVSTEGSDKFMGARSSERWAWVEIAEGHEEAGKEGYVSLVWLEPATERAQLDDCDF